jgi:hypothetical protein
LSWAPPASSPRCAFESCIRKPRATDGLL